MWRGAIGLNAGAELASRLEFGLGAKLIHSEEMCSWTWMLPPGLGMDVGGTGNTWAVDVGALYHPRDGLSIGLAVAEVGPGITYSETGETGPLPTTFRLGGCWTPVDNGWVRLSVLPEFDKLLVGLFADSSSLHREFLTTSKAFSVELCAFNVLSLRAGYFEDIAWNRGGFIYEKYYVRRRKSVWEALTVKGLGRLDKVGFCWGLGIGDGRMLRLDFASDAAIYDFATSNWKLSLTVTDPAALLRAFGSH